MLNAKEIGKRIKEKQTEKNYKQKDLIEKTGISKGAISNYCSGARIPETESILKISFALDTSMEWLLTGKSTNENFTDEEKEIIKNLRLLPDPEKYKFYGRIEEAAEKYKNVQTESSISKIG